MPPLCQILPGDTPEERKLNAVYAISCAHKMGCMIFATWEGAAPAVAACSNLATCVSLLAMPLGPLLPVSSGCFVFRAADLVEVQPKTVLLVLAAAMQEDMRRQRSTEEGGDEGVRSNQGGDIAGAGEETTKGAAAKGGASGEDAKRQGGPDDGAEPEGGELQAADRTASSKRGLFGGWFKSGGRQR